MSYIFNKEELAIIIDMMEKLSTKCEPKSCADLVMDSINNKPKKYTWYSIDEPNIEFIPSFTKKIFKKISTVYK